MRSLLFVPGDSPRKIDKAQGCGADVLILDLEDSVSTSAKESARRITAEALAARRSGGSAFHVRVNGLETGLTSGDLLAVIPGRPAAVMLPKAVGGASILALATMLDRVEAEHGVPIGSTRILPVATETAAGVLALGTLAGSSPRLLGITWGGEDLSADIGAEANRDPEGRFTEPYRIVRSLALLAAVAASVEPVDGVFTAYRDAAGLAAECREARRDGFTAKMAIHPDQVAVINEVFTPTPEVVAAARRVVAAFAAEPGAGVVGLDGEMLDRPHLVRAERVLARIPAGAANA